MNSFSSAQTDRLGTTRTDPLSVFLLTRSLTIGGAEHQLVELAAGLSQRGHEVSVGVFYAGGALEERLRKSGVEIVDLAKSGRWDVAGFLLRTSRVLRKRKPDVIYSFLGGANIVAAALKRSVPDAKLVWSVRNSEFDMSVDHWLARAAHKLEAALADLPDAIIANSSAGRDFAASRGFPNERIAIVPNGIDTDRFRPDAELRAKQRRELGLDHDEIAVGVLARLNATKDYPTFLRAAAEIAASESKARFLCVGTGSELETLQLLAGELGIAEKVIFPGELDPAGALNAFDIGCSTSLTEGFSNAIAEAMACGLPCVVTDVGDSAMIVRDAGVVVPPSSPTALANAIKLQIEILPEHDSAIPRARIVEHFSMSQMVDRTAVLFDEILVAPPQR